MQRKSDGVVRRRKRALLGPPPGLEAFRVSSDSEIAILSWPVAAPVEACGSLTPAEAEVLECLGAGLSNAEIAARRGRSPRTVANQVASIFTKLGVRGRPELFSRLAASVRRE